MILHPRVDPHLADMFQCRHFPHLQTSFFVINRNNHQHQYFPIRNLYKYSCQVIDNQLLNSSALFIIIIICHYSWYFLFKPDLTWLMLPISQSKTIIYSCPMIVHQIQGIACHKVSSQNQYARKINPWVLRQKSVDNLSCNADIGFSWRQDRLLVGFSSFRILIFIIGIR